MHHNATLDRTFFALSDPTRRSILERLAAGPATIGELAEPLGLTLNGIKKHVGILQEVDLVVTAKVGRARECRLGPARLQDATGWIDAWIGSARCGGAPVIDELRFERVIDAPPDGLPTTELRDEHGRGLPNAFARLERAIHARK